MEEAAVDRVMAGGSMMNEELGMEEAAVDKGMAVGQRRGGCR
jgi:hypothetical protein